MGSSQVLKPITDPFEILLSFLLFLLLLPRKLS